MRFLIVDIVKDSGSIITERADDRFSTTYNKLIADYNIDNEFLNRLADQKTIHIDNIKTRDGVISRTFIYIAG